MHAYTSKRMYACANRLKRSTSINKSLVKGILLIRFSCSQVNALPKIVGFLPGTRFPSTGNVDRLGVGRVSCVGLQVPFAIQYIF